MVTNSFAFFIDITMEGSWLVSDFEFKKTFYLDRASRLVQPGRPGFFQHETRCGRHNSAMENMQIQMPILLSRSRSRWTCLISVNYNDIHRTSTVACLPTYISLFISSWGRRFCFTSLCGSWSCSCSFHSLTTNWNDFLRTWLSNNWISFTLCFRQSTSKTFIVFSAFGDSVRFVFYFRLQEVSCLHSSLNARPHLIDYTISFTQDNILSADAFRRLPPLFS